MTTHLRQTRLSIPMRWALLPVGKGARFGNRLGFVSGCKINTFFRGKTLSVKKWFFFNLVESLLDYHAENAGEQWAAEGKFKMH